MSKIKVTKKSCIEVSDMDSENNISYCHNNMVELYHIIVFKSYGFIAKKVIRN